MIRALSLHRTALLLIAALAIFPSRARADDGGDASATLDADMLDADMDASDAGDDAGGMIGGDPVVVMGDGYAVACGGELCDTIGAGVRCDMSPAGAGLSFGPIAFAAITVAVAFARRRRRQHAAMLGVIVLMAARGARADVVPEPTELPEEISIDDALRIFRQRGLDLLIAEANVRLAEGVVRSAGASPNPVASASYGFAHTYQPNDPGGSGGATSNSNTWTTPHSWSFGLSDSAAIEDALSGKRDLRLTVARNALAAAKLSRVDAERAIAFQVKGAYVQVAQGVLAYQFAKVIADSNARLLDLFQTKLANGAINSGVYAQMATQKLESDQALDAAIANLRQARLALAFLLGVRGAVSDFGVDTKVLDFRVPAALANATEPALLRVAFGARPDLLSAGYAKASSAAQIRLVKRQVFPDIALSFGYATGGWGGIGTNGPVGPPTFTVGLSVPIPLLYQLQGEITQANANDDINALARAKIAAQVTNDVTTAFAAFTSSRKLVERMESGGLLRYAREARDAVRAQLDKGLVSLTDFIVAQQTYVATNVEYIGDLTNYWTAVYQLEAAVAVELR